MNSKEEPKSICSKRDTENIELVVKRIISKWSPDGGEQVFFNVETVNGQEIKSPLSLCIYNYPKYGETLPLKWIFCERLLIKKTKQDIIYNSRSRIKLWFKLLIVVEFEDDKFDTIMLPDDIGIKVCYSENVKFPIRYGKNESLEVSKLPGTNENAYLWTRCVPFTDQNWIGEIPRTLLDNPTLQSEIVVKYSSVFWDIEGEAEIREESTVAQGTMIRLSVIADIIDKLGIHEDICISGSILEYSEK
jgi:hypothetical protein